MNNMFEWYSSLGEINPTNFNTENVTYMNNIFKGCSSIRYLKLSIKGIFSGCSSFKNLFY